MKLENSSVFVTGAGGFIGSHLVEELVGRGCKVVCFIEYNSESDIGMLKFLDQEKLDKIQIIFGNLSDAQTLTKAMQGCSYLFHLGAIISIPYSYQSPRHTIQTNVMGTLNVMQAALETGIKKIVHTSTSEVYGSAQYVPIDEKHPLVGQSPYSASKIGADKIVQSFHLSFNLPVVTVRPFNCFGPRQSLRAVIPTIISQALDGKNIRLGNISTTRDYTFVKDTVLGIILALEAENNEGEEYNISSNFEISIKNIALKVVSLVNPALSIEIDEQRVRPRNSEVLRLWGNNSKAKQDLGWAPHYSFEQGLQETIKYLQENVQEEKIKGYNF